MSDFIVWDSLEPIPKNKKVILWRGFDKTSSFDTISILDIVEENKDSVRDAYLEWSYDLGERKAFKMSVKDHFEIKPNLSFWWMSSFSEKCNFSKSPQIDNVIKLIAFYQWANLNNIKSIQVQSKNEPLIKALKKLSEQSSFQFSRHSKNFHMPRFVLPQHFKAFAWLLGYLFKSRHLKGVGIDLWKKSSANITIFSYLANLSNKNLRLNKHESNFWSHLPSKLIDRGHSINWLHIFTPSKQIPNTKEASKILNSFNVSNVDEVHVFLESFINYKIVFEAIKDWIKISIVSSKIKRSIMQDDFLVQVMLDDWNKSFKGIHAINNCLNLNLFLAAMESGSNQKLGLYLQENQSWEMGLNHSWKACSHNEIVGVPHSTTRFWDLRYANDSRIHSDINKNRYPKPDFIAINGKAQKNYFEKIAYPDAEIKLVEALRFFHLEHNKNTTIPKISHQDDDYILILGDYLMENNDQLIQMLLSAIPLLPSRLKFIFKPHPACFVSISKFKELPIVINEEDISSLLQKSKIAISTNVTTAALDAFFQGIPLACMIDSNKLNLSPMLEIDQTVFVKTYQDLVEKILLSLEGCQELSIKADNFFELDSSLPKWLSFIDNRLGSKIFIEDTV